MKTTTANTQLSKTANAGIPLPAFLYLFTIHALGLMALSLGFRDAVLNGNRQWIYLLILTAAASLLSTRISKRGTAAGSVTISLGDFFVFVTMVVLGPAAAAVMGAIEGLVSSLRVGIRHLHKILFNIAQLALTSFLIGSLVKYLGGSQALQAETGISLGFLVTLLGCGVTYFFLNSLLVIAAMRLVSGQSLRELGGKGFLWALPTIGVNSSLVVILLSLLGPIHLGLALALLPLLLVAYLLTGVKQTDEESSLLGARFLPAAFAGKTKAYLLGVVLATVPIYFYCLHHTVTSSSWDWLYVALLAVAASCFPIRLFSISDKIWLTLSDVFVFVALFHFGVEVAVVVASLEAVTFNIRQRAQPSFRWMFNLAQIILVAFLVGQFFELLQAGLSRPGGMGFSNVTMLLLAPWLVGFLYYSLSSTFTGLAVAWSSGKSFYQVWTTNLKWCAMSIVGSMLAALTFVLNGCFPW